MAIYPGWYQGRTDGIYRNGGAQLTLQLAPDGQGYAGTFHIGLQMT